MVWRRFLLRLALCSAVGIPEAGVGDANTALDIVANALNAYGQGNLTFFNGKEAEIEKTYRELSIVEEALLDIEQTLGSPLTIEDELYCVGR